MKRSLIEIPDNYCNKVFLSQDQMADITYGDIDNLLPTKVLSHINRKVILCICSKTAACAAGFIAFEQADSVPIMVGYDITKQQIEEICLLYGVNLCWIPESKIDGMPDKRCWKELYKFRDYRLIIKTQMGVPEFEVHPDLALLLSTSGSTGEQKFVRLSKENIRTSINLVQMIANFNEKDVGVLYLPLEHCFTIGTMHALYKAGASLACLPNGLMELASPGFVDRHRVSVLISVTFVIDFLRKTGFFTLKHPSLRLIANGAGATPKETQDYLDDYMKSQGGVLIPTYGQTEVTIVASALAPQYVRRIYNSIGRPYGDIEMFIDKPDNNGIGELVIRSSAVMMGYAYNGLNLKLGDVTGGVLYTGDLAVVDDEGFYYIKGRKSRFAKIAGKRISLQMLEERLTSAFIGEEFVCVSNDETVNVLTTCNSEAFEKIEHFIANIAGIPVYIVNCNHCNQIPRNETGKIKYHEIEKQVY